MIKPVQWIGSSKSDLSAFPDVVKAWVGGAIWDTQRGLKAKSAKPLQAREDYEQWQKSQQFQ